MDFWEFIMNAGLRIYFVFVVVVMTLLKLNRMDGLQIHVLKFIILFIAVT